MEHSAVGILPIAVNSLGLPYPDALFPLAYDTVLIDSTLEQLNKLEIEAAYIVAQPIIIDKIANAIQYMRRGIDIRYLPVPYDTPLDYLAYAIRGCRHASTRYAFDRFIVSDPRAYYALDISKQLLAHAHATYTTVPGLLLLNDTAVTQLRRHQKTFDSTTCLREVLGNIPFDVQSDGYTLDTWAHIKVGGPIADSRWI